jgi:DNA-binding response OmpR family regulator
MLPCPVLLVDDDEFARGFARAVLLRAGFDVYDADGVAAAVAAASSLKPTVVVTDWHLPDGSGGELVQQLKSIGSLAPVILITGDASQSDVLHASGHREFAAILGKPFSPSALEQAVRVAVGP